MPFPSLSKPSPYDVQIGKVLKRMQELGVEHDDYPKLLGYLERFNALRDRQPEPLNLNTVVNNLGMLLGIGAMTGFERYNVLSTKATQLLRRPE